MDLQGMISTYGYPALLAGTLLEGETILLISGFLAHNGYLSLPWVMVTAFGGAFLADQFFFRLGKRKGAGLLDRHPHWHARLDRVRLFIDRYHILAILSYRFIYGMRTVTPIVIGITGFSTRRFVILNLVSTSAWAVLVSLAGYFFGQLVETVLKDVRRYELVIIVAAAIIASAIWLYRYRIKERRNGVDNMK